MGTMPHNIDYYAGEFGKAANESAEKGAGLFVEYVKDQMKFGGFSAKEAFDICVCNMGYCDGVPSYFVQVKAEDLTAYKHKAIEKARQLMAEELAQS